MYERVQHYNAHAGEKKFHLRVVYSQHTRRPRRLQHCPCTRFHTPIHEIHVVFTPDRRRMRRVESSHSSSGTQSGFFLRITKPSSTDDSAMSTQAQHREDKIEKCEHVNFVQTSAVQRKTFRIIKNDEYHWPTVRCEQKTSTVPKIIYTVIHDLYMHIHCIYMHVYASFRKLYAVK